MGVKNNSEINRRFVVNTEQKLDALLKFFFEMDFNDAQIYNQKVAAFKLESEERGIFTSKEYPFLEQFIVDEGYFVTQDGILTLKGKLFWSDGRGGYVNKKLKEIEQAEYLTKLQERSNQNDVKLVNWTKKLTYGTFALVAWEILRFVIDACLRNRTS